MAKTKLIAGKTKAGKNHFHKKHPTRTAPGDRSEVSEKYPEPNPNGFGTPLVLIWDKDGALIMDLIPSGTGYNEVALVSFTYNFREKEEDECIIVFSCASVVLMDYINFYQKQDILVSWGYMDGNLRPPIGLVVVDTKEVYNDKGCEFTLTCSDNLSYFSRGNSPMVARLETSLGALNKYLSGVQGKIADSLEVIAAYKAYGWGFQDNMSVYNDQIIQQGKMGNLSGKIKRTTNEQMSDYLTSLRNYYNINHLNLGLGATEVETSKSIELFGHITGVYDYTAEQLMAITNGTDVHPNATDVPVPTFPESQYLKPDSDEAKLIAKLPYAITGLRLPVTGKNAQALAQNAVDKLSPYPMQVVGRDGKMVTYNKNRAMKANPERTFEWKGGNGNLLDFTFDTNAKYSDDDNVLRQFKMDPKTGDITTVDHINSLKKIVTTTTVEENSEKEVERGDQNQLNNVILNHPDQLSQVAGTTPYKKYSVVGPDGGPALVTYHGDQAMSHVGYNQSKGSMVWPMPALSTTSMVRPVCANMTIPLHESQDTIKNEIANLRRGEQEKTKANAKILGDPQMVSGIKVAFKGLAKRRCGDYFITACTHTIDSGGYTTKLDMYWIAGISIGVDTVTTKSSKKDLTKKAGDIKESKIHSHPDSTEIIKRGYYLRSDFVKGDFELKAERIDKDWNKKMPGNFYWLTYHQKDGDLVGYVIKLPLTDPIVADYPLQAFGYDALYDLLGCHDEMQVMSNIELQKMDPLDTRNSDYQEEPHY